MFERNIEATYTVLDAAGRAGADIVWASSESAYGLAFAEETPLPASLPMDEDHPMAPEDPYGTSKVAGEEIAKIVARRDGVSVASVRALLDSVSRRVQLPRRGRGGPRGRRGQLLVLRGVRDVAGIVAAALEADFEGHEAFHAAASDNYVGRPTADADVDEPRLLAE